MKIPFLLSTICLLAVHTGRAATALTISDEIGAPGAVTINPGDSFQFTLRFESTAELTTSLSYYLETEGIASGGFVITGRDITTSAFPDLVTSDGIALSAANASLDPVNDHDLGGLTADAPNGIGSFIVARFTIQSLPGLAPGVYTIGTDSAFATDEAFDAIALNRPSYSVTVVPEPGTSLFLGLGLAGRFLRRRR